MRYQIESVLYKLVMATGLDLCVAGGAVRDLLHGKEPKDIDIEILGIPREPCNYEHIKGNILDPLVDDLLSLEGVSDLKVFVEYEGASLDAHVRFVIKCKVDDWDCDIILRSPHPQDTAELVTMYDMNINQVTLHKGKIEAHRPVVNCTVEPTGKKISLARLKRIYTKYPEYDFSKMLPFTYEEEELKQHHNLTN
ncbi:hypothetical protein [Vibrio phage VEN]|uniref:Uncharacterized protein n=1 Tax=Vibrio phage VEN TaxID=2059879 RepID=A0A2H5BN11_9CAUD|nr:nucleotidyltransferase [Vibrio phage VEN]AUG87671.1 hypothetical protein [Vibrio phage VEN]